MGRWTNRSWWPLRAPRHDLGIGSNSQRSCSDSRLSISLETAYYPRHVGPIGDAALLPKYQPRFGSIAMPPTCAPHRRGDAMFNTFGLSVKSLSAFVLALVLVIPFENA